jgi:hypothetical protein
MIAVGEVLEAGSLSMAMRFLLLFLDFPLGMRFVFPIFLLTLDTPARLS